MAELSCCHPFWLHRGTDQHHSNHDDQEWHADRGVLDHQKDQQVDWKAVAAATAAADAA
jgi:hypothetical protein